MPFAFPEPQALAPAQLHHVPILQTRPPRCPERAADDGDFRPKLSCWGFSGFGDEVEEFWGQEFGFGVWER